MGKFEFCFHYYLFMISHEATQVFFLTNENIFFPFPCSDVGSLMTITLNEKFVPTLAGQRKLLASLDCQQLTQVHGVADILVREK